MDPNFLVFDINSDEEPAIIDHPSRDIGDDDHQWLMGILENVDKTMDSDNLTQPKVVEVNSVDLDDDDECVVLDYDPCKDVDVDGDNNDNDNDDDEIVVVGEKGQIACRDYPHPRHDCAKFPFKSCPHEKYCTQCHCYVCDIRAPCEFWGTGCSNIDHCHANGKLEIWKNLRQSFRQLKDGGVNTSYAPITSQNDQVVPQFGQVASPGGLISVGQVASLSGLTSVGQVASLGGLTSVPNFITQNQVPRPTAIRPCSSSARIGAPDIMNMGHNQTSGYVQSINKVLAQPVLQQPRPVQNNNAGLVRSGTGNAGQLFVSSRTTVMTPGTGRGLMPNNQPVSGSLHWSGSCPLWQRNAYGASLDTSSRIRQDVAPNFITQPLPYQVPAQVTVNSNFANSMSLPEVYGSSEVHCPLSNDILFQQRNQYQDISSLDFNNINYGCANMSNQNSQQIPMGNWVFDTTNPHDQGVNRTAGYPSNPCLNQTSGPGINCSAGYPSNPCGNQISGPGFFFQ